MSISSLLWKQRGVVRSTALAVAILSTVTGCSSKPEWEITHPIEGVVTFKGKPIANAEIAFFPQDSSVPDRVRPKAKSTEGGKFMVWTYARGDGAPEGSYKVTVVHNEVAISKDTIVVKPNDLPMKYSRLESTDLVVRIAAGQREIPTLDLK